MTFDRAFEDLSGLAVDCGEDNAKIVWSAFLVRLGLTHLTAGRAVDMSNWTLDMKLMYRLLMSSPLLHPLCK